MATIMRRKRKLEERDDTEVEDIQTIFRRAFEARFTPLAPEPGRSQVEAEDIEEEDDDDDEDEDDDQDVSDWSGISSSDSDEEEETGPQVVEYIDPRQTKLDTDKALRKAFMSSKPPTSTSTPTTNPTSKQKSKQDDAEDLTEVTNLKNDLALQKLLRDSHLLSASSSRTPTPTLAATGIARHKSTDLHLQSLGAKTSVFTQKKMPMAQRRHEAQKARMLEERRRAHAKDAGIVLEKEKRVAKAWMERKREKSLGAPSVGRFKRGVLSLTKKDVRSITRDGEGGRRRGGKGKGKSRGRGGKR